MNSSENLNSEDRCLHGHIFICLHCLIYSMVDSSCRYNGIYLKLASLNRTELTRNHSLGISQVHIRSDHLPETGPILYKGCPFNKPSTRVLYRSPLYKGPLWFVDIFIIKCILYLPLKQKIKLTNIQSPRYPETTHKYWIRLTQMWSIHTTQQGHVSFQRVTFNVFI